MRKTTSFYVKPLLAVMLAAGVLSVQAAPIPDQATLQFRGSYGIPATMTFKRSGSQYTVSASINVPFYKIRFESGGTISGNQLNPSYYRDVRNGKVYASAQFSGSKATYGKTGETKTENVRGRVMDLFTLAWQLVFTDGQLPPNLMITNGKRLYPVRGISPAGTSQITFNGRKIDVNQFNVRRGDDTAQYGFAPALNGVPAIIRYNDGDKNYALTIKSVSINGQTVQP